MILKVSGDNRCLYIAMRDDLLVIPRSAFLDTALAEHFLSAAAAYMRGEAPSSDDVGAIWPPAPGVLP